MNRQGIDVSEYQGSVNWKAVATCCSFVFCKVTQGLQWEDPIWTAERVKEIRAAGLAFGGYAYAQNSGDSGAAEAKHFVEALKESGWKAHEAGEFFDRFWRRGKFRGAQLAGWDAVRGHSIPGALDIESGVGGRAGRRFVRDFVREYRRLTGHFPIVYTGSFWRDSLRNPIIAIRCPLWLAAYAPSPIGFIPSAWRRPIFWQYTDAFHCPGVTGPCDGDKFMGHRPRRRRKK